jgi:hypothetical protein
MTRNLALGALLAFALLHGGPAAGEEPAPPWNLDFKHTPLDTYSLAYKDGSAKTFYYLTFTVKNSSQQPAPLHLAIRAYVGSDAKERTTLPALPAPDAEEAIRRISRSPGLKNVQELNKLGMLQPGESANGIAVFGTFDREWDQATVTVGGLEPYSRRCRVRKYGEAGFTVFHRAYQNHNREVEEKAGAGATFQDVHAIVKHDVIWKMKFHREGDEFAPQVDRIFLDAEGWDVEGAEIAFEPKAPFRG